MTRQVSRGLTLIELIVAMTVFALVAVMGLQALTGSLRLRDRLTATADGTAELVHAMALLRNDLSAAMPMLFFPPETSTPRSALADAARGQGFALSLGGQPGLAGPGGLPDAASFQRVEWRLDTSASQLTRRVWPTLYPVSDDQAGPELAILDGVQSIALRSYWSGQGWIEELRLNALDQTPRPDRSGNDDQAGAPPESYSDLLPRAVEIVLETRDHGRITLLEFLQ